MVEISTIPIVAKIATTARATKIINKIAINTLVKNLFSKETIKTIAIKITTTIIKLKMLPIPPVNDGKKFGAHSNII